MRACCSSSFMVRSLSAACFLVGAPALSIDQGQRQSAPLLNIDQEAVWASRSRSGSDELVDNDELADKGSINERAQFGWKSVHPGDRMSKLPHNSEPVYTNGQGYRQVMQNIQDTQYLSYFQLGGQTMAGILDTGSFELVVFGKNCSTCGTAAKYDPSLSSMHSSGKMFSGQYYGSGETWSQDAVDQLRLGPYTVIQAFWEVNKARMPVLAQSQFQAIVGLGPPGTPQADAWAAARNAARNVSEAMASTGAVSEADLKKARDKAKIAVAMGSRTPVLKSANESMFSICIGKEPGSDGVFVWNDTSALQHQELFHEVPVFGERSWSVVAKNARLSYVATPTADGLSAGANDSESELLEGQVFNSSSSINLGCEDGCGLLLDSGTSLLALPSSVVNKLVQIVSKEGTGCDNMMELPHLLFELNGKVFSLPPDVYVAHTLRVPSYMQSFVRVRNLGNSTGRLSGKGNGCDILVMESYAKSQAGPLWIFGMPFFRKYYTSFALTPSGFGKAIYLAGAGPSCTPTKRRVQVHDGPGNMWVRILDPQQLWMPLSVQLAAMSEWVRL